MLLLTTFNIADRTDMYRTVIKWYLANTTYSMIVVDSFGSGFNISNPRLHYVIYNQSEFTIFPFRFKSNSEAMALAQVREKAWGFMKGFKYVVKLTGKYIIPTLTQELNKIPKRTHWILQNRTGKPFRVNTELFGVRVNKWNDTTARLQRVILAYMLEIRLGYILVADGYFYH
eukprot:UN28205